jgi:hypothetical protein
MRTAATVSLGLVLFAGAGGAVARDIAVPGPGSAERAPATPPAVVGFGEGAIRLDYEAAAIGSERCATCHHDLVAASRTHHMARTSAAVTRPSRERWFSTERLGRRLEWPAAAPSPPPRYRVESGGDGVVLEAERPGGGARRARVTAVFGSGHRGFTPIAVEGRGMRELRVSFFAERDRWVLTPGSEEDPDILGHLRSAESTLDCLECHTTVLAWDDDGLDVERSVFGIGCERCHGPGSAHAEGVIDGSVEPLIFNPGRLRGADQVRFCGQCHRHPSTVEPHRVLRRLPDLARHAGVGLMLSACFRRSPPESVPTCIECHDPHRNINHGGDDFNRACRRCHARPADDHTAAAIESSSDCVACHMPIERRGFLGLAFTDHWIRVPGAPPPGETAARDEHLRLLEASYREALGSAGIGPERRSKLSMRLGKALVLQGEVADGLARLREALAHDPLYRDRLLAAEYHRRAGETAVAIAILEQAICVAPENNRAYHDLARLHIGAAAPDRAARVLDAWEQALPGDPHAAELRRELEALGAKPR